VIHILLLRVLLLEDSPLDADLIVDWLGSDGLNCQVRRVQTRDDYVAELREGQFDLLLADYSLPGFDGIEALDIAQRRATNLPFHLRFRAFGRRICDRRPSSAARPIMFSKAVSGAFAAFGGNARCAKLKSAKSAAHRNHAAHSRRSEFGLVFARLRHDFARARRLAVPHFAELLLD
jgi:CheY-like chemotaxis protein